MRNQVKNKVANEAMAVTTKWLDAKEVTCAWIFRKQNAMLIVAVQTAFLQSTHFHCEVSSP